MLAWLASTAVCPRLTQALEVELEPHQEHEQQQAELAEGIEVRVVGGREHRLRDRRRQPSEERRAEGDAHRHLADHLRLADPAGRDTGHPGARDQDGHREQEQWEAGPAGRRGPAQRAPAGRRRRLQPGAELERDEHADDGNPDKPRVLQHHARDLVHDRPPRGVIPTRYTRLQASKLVRKTAERGTVEVAFDLSC